MSWRRAGACLALALRLSACGGEDRQDPARQHLRTEVLTVRDALRTQPSSPILYYQLGQIYERYGVTDSARMAYERSVGLLESLHQAHARLAQIYLDGGDTTRSIAAWRQVARLQPQDVESRNNLGYLLRMRGDLDGAEAAYRSALDLKPDFAQTLNNLGQVLRAQERWDEAIEVYHRAMAADPTLRGAYVNLSRLYRDMGNEPAEREMLTEMLQRFGRESTEGRYALARLFELESGAPPSGAPP